MVNASGNEVITLGFFRRSDAMRRIRDACLLWFEAAKALPRGQAPPRLMHWSEFKWVDRYIVHGHMMDTPKGERTSLMRKYMMLFHPDRFVSRFSCFFEDEGFNIIVARVQVFALVFEQICQPTPRVVRVACVTENSHVCYLGTPWYG